MINDEIKKLIRLYESGEVEDEFFDFAKKDAFSEGDPTLTFQLVKTAMREDPIAFDFIYDYSSFIEFLSGLTKEQYEELIPLMIEHNVMPCFNGEEGMSEDEAIEFYKRLTSLFEKGSENLRTILANNLGEHLNNADFLCTSWEKYQNLYLFYILYGAAEDKDYYGYFYLSGANEYTRTDLDLPSRFFPASFKHDPDLFETEYRKPSSDKKRLSSLKKMRDFYIADYLLDGDNMEEDADLINEDFLSRLFMDIRAENPTLFDQIRSKIHESNFNPELARILNSVLSRQQTKATATKENNRKPQNSSSRAQYTSKEKYSSRKGYISKRTYPSKSKSSTSTGKAEPSSGYSTGQSHKSKSLLGSMYSIFSTLRTEYGKGTKGRRKK